ncbi:universal stress protein [Ekhidna sp.]|jgi:nucleotide-binding universal stress UspA family protein|uniref:universal stress protein n=1 Tax=Ekhidna sp. TaxID=2608089 RepID=UPI0032EC7E9A
MSEVSFRKTLVTLDATLMDGFVLEYVSNFYKSFGIKEIVFLHVIKDIDTRIEMDGYTEAENGALDEIMAKLNRKVSQYDFKDCECTVEVKQGSPSSIILKHAVEASFDLIVMGRKRSLGGSGIVSSHIARKSPTSILFVTQNMNPSLRNILVPVDFSEHSSLAVKAGLRIEALSEAKLSLINIFDVPLGYYKLGKTYEEFAKIMEGHAKNDFDLFLKTNKIDKKYPCHFNVRGSKSKIDIVFEHALDSRSDLIIIGSQGRTNASAVLLGSFAEKMVFRDTDIPVLIIKKEGENMSLLQALLSL